MHRVRISGYPPTSVDPQIATVYPAQFTQLIHKRCELRLGFRITHQRADPPHPLGLRARRERPRCRAAEQRDEVATDHSITSSARPSSGSGTVRPSALAVFILMTSSTFTAF